MCVVCWRHHVGPNVDIAEDEHYIFYFIIINYKLSLSIFVIIHKYPFLVTHFFTFIRYLPAFHLKTALDLIADLIPDMVTLPDGAAIWVLGTSYRAPFEPETPTGRTCQDDCSDMLALYRNILCFQRSTGFKCINTLIKSCDFFRRLI